MKYSSIRPAALLTYPLVEAPEKPLLLGLAVTILAFLFQRFQPPELSLVARDDAARAPLAGLAAGSSQGAIRVSGPIVAMWLHGYRLPKNA